MTVNNSNKQNILELGSSNPAKTMSASDQKKQAELKEAAAAFEGMFLSMMMKTMRKASESFESTLVKKSNAEDIFTEMLDNEYVDLITKSPDTGLGNSLYQYLVDTTDEYSGLRETNKNDANKKNDISKHNLQSVNKLKEMESLKTEDSLLNLKYSIK